MRRLAQAIRLSLLALPVVLAGCGDFPEPMLHHPGRMGMLLSHPPPQRLVVPVPGRALLDDQSAAVFASDLSNAMVAQTVPAFAQKPQRGDWVLAVGATLNGNTVTPAYSIIDPRGHVQGSLTGAPVSSQAWANGDATVLTEAANSAGPQLAALLSNIDAALKESDPNSLYNRPPRLDFSGITGAPGDGDDSLAKEMRQDIANMGVILVSQQDQADYLMHARVRVTRVNPTTQHVEIYWIIDTVDGKEAGRVAQLHDIPKGSLDTYWGDVAVVAASEAALGVKEVIDNNIGKKSAHPPSSPATSAASPPSSPGQTS
jgi:hypothetical protein